MPETTKKDITILLESKDGKYVRADINRAGLVLARTDQTIDMSLISLYSMPKELRCMQPYNFHFFRPYEREKAIHKANAEAFADLISKLEDMVTDSGLDGVQVRITADWPGEHTYILGAQAQLFRYNKQS